MNSLLFILYACIFSCIWYVFNEYFKDHKKEYKQPIKIGKYLQKWKEHFSSNNETIQTMVKKALSQINEPTNINAPQVKEADTVKTDMELYLIGPDTDTFLKNINENRQNATLTKSIINPDLHNYLGANKKQNTIVAML